jgi:hypothetical protein
MKPKYFLFFCLSFLIFNSSLLIGTVRYVSKTGTSTPPYTSWLTSADSIQKCINICVDGDTIYVANGVYKENLVISNTSLYLFGSSMDSTIVDGTGLSDSTIFFNNSNSTMENFNIYGRGIRSYSYAIIFQNMPLTIKNCKISRTGYGIVSVGNAGVYAYNLILENLTLEGLSLYNDGYNVVSDCLILLNTDQSSGIVIGGPHPNSIHTITNNIILFTGTINPRHGIYLGLPKKVYINNNLISRFIDNIYINDVRDTVFIKNNALMYQFGGAASILAGSQNVIVTNVVLLKNKTGIDGGYQVRSNYNLFWKNITDLEFNVSYGDSDIVADPMFVKDTIPTPNGNYDFHLQKYSAAIDKGDPSILDIDGSRSDIGLFGGPLGESYTYQDLAPKPPRNLTVSMDSGLVHLKWDKNTEADLLRYRVYRDTVPDFVYDTTKIIAVLSDTTFYDDPPQKFISGNYYYKLIAIDSAYHQSPASEEVHINITGIPEAPPIVVEHYNLLQNYPNPFNPSTTIPYRLKAPGYVKVMVYNLLGEQVKVLVNKYQSAGYYEVLFHPTTTERQSAEGKIEFETGYGDIVSGIYLYRIEVIGEGNIPVFTDMKKMMLVK